MKSDVTLRCNAGYWTVIERALGKPDVIHYEGSNGTKAIEIFNKVTGKS